MGRGKQDRDIGRYKENLVHYLSLHDDKFDYGRSHYQMIVIPGYNADMSSLAMQKLFLNERLSKEQMGALSRYISAANNKEWRQEAMRLLPSIAAIFRDHNACFTRLVPQDFLLSLMGQDGGLCNQLAIMMSLAIDKGEGTINAVVNKLFRVASVADLGTDPHRVQRFIANLRQVYIGRSRADFSDVSTSEKFSLREIVEKLSQSTTTKIYRLNTQTHALLAGVRFDAQTTGEKTFYFYDPNWGVYGFLEEKKYLQALKSFFNTDVNNQMMSQYYGAFGSKDHAKFELCEINLINIASQPWGDNQHIGDFLSAL